MNDSSAAVRLSAGRESWLPTLQLAAQEVFELMLASRLEKPAEGPAEKNLGITAMVGLAGHISAVLTVRCSGRSAAQMASRMLGINATEDGPELWDAIGEICNMIAGNFKNKISGLGDGCMLSVPTVITGGDYNMRTLANDEISFVLMFEKEPVVFALEVHS
jgi:chemotaxis protein CheX